MTIQNPYYYGSAENKLNSKGQVVMPARFRSVLSEEDANWNYVITRGEESCLYVYTHRQFEKIKDNVKGVALETGDSEFYRRFMAEACAVDIDTQGRFVLPPSLMKAVAITGPTILFIGMDDRLEIWEPSIYSKARIEDSRYEETRRNAARRIFGI